MEQQQSYFLGAVSETHGKAEQWAVELLVGSTLLEFKIDTGTDVTVICEEAYFSITHIPPDSPGGEIQCLGRIQSTVTYKGRTYPLTAYIAHGHSVNNLLSQKKENKIGGDESG